MNTDESRCVEINMTRFLHMIWEGLYEIEKNSLVIRGVFCGYWDFTVQSKHKNSGCTNQPIRDNRTDYNFQ